MKNWINADSLQPGSGLRGRQFVVKLEDGSKHLAGWGGGAFTDEKMTDGPLFRDVQLWIMLPEEPPPPRREPSPMDTVRLQK